MNQLTIQTSRLRLIAGTRELTNAAITDKSVLSTLLNATVPTTWPHKLLKDAEPFFADCLEKDPESVGWWIWYVVLKSTTPNVPDILIGNTGFKGLPRDGTIERGSSYLEEFQGLGYGTEAAMALMDWAFKDPRVNNIIGQTLPHLKPSIRAMEKCGMALIGEGIEEGVENVIRYGITRSDWVRL